MKSTSDPAFIFGVILLFIALFVIFFVWRSVEAKDFESRRLYFAAGTLIGLGILFALSMGMYYWENVSPSNNSSNAGKEIFEACLNVVPPIVTLVLGYYFGASESHRGNNREIDMPESQSKE